MQFRTVCGGLIALGFIAISTLIAALFGWQLGTTDTTRYVYASAGGLADVFKALLPLVIVAAWRLREYVRCVVCAVIFAVFTAYSLTSSFGLSAIQGAEKLGEHTAVANTYRDKRAEFDRLTKERAELPKFQPRTETAGDEARKAVERAEAATNAECVKRGPRCRELEGIEREKRAELATISDDLATARTANDLDSRIATIRHALEGPEAKAAATEADPRAATFAKVTGRSEDVIRDALHAFFALLLELGSGLGLYAVFGHHGGRAAPSNALAIMPPRADVPTITSERALSAAEPVIVETPTEAIERFVLEQVRPALGSRIAGAQMYAAYVDWCERQGLEPLSTTKFGQLIPWRKDRVGGRVRYLDAMLATRPVGLAPSLQVAIDNTAGAQLAQSAA